MITFYSNNHSKIEVHMPESNSNLENKDPKTGSPGTGSLLEEVVRKKNMTRVALVLSFFIFLYFIYRTYTGAITWPFAVLGLAYLGLNVWRYYKIDQQVKKLQGRG
jgi:hypothetical protein